MVGSPTGVRKTPQGGLIASANLTRVGVLTYTNPDGSQVRELRHPDEVFKKDSLATLANAPLTVTHPRELVTPANWRQVAVGHVDGTPKESGRFVAADVQVMDAGTIDQIEKGDLVELSCGYRCDVDNTPGTYDGEKYDAVQRNINYNHVAIGPKDWGRAGSEVRLRLDGSGYLISANTSEGAANTYVDTRDMADPNTPKPAAPAPETRTDEAEVLRGQNAFLKSENQRLDGEVKALTEKLNDTARLDALVSARVELVTKAAGLLGADYKCDGKSDVQIMTDSIKKVRPEMNLDGKGPDYIKGAFAIALENHTDARKAQESIQSNTPTVLTVRDDSKGESPVSAAAQRNAEAGRNAWRAPATPAKA